MSQTLRPVIRNAFRKMKTGAAFRAAPVAVCLVGLSAASLSGCSFQPRDAYSKNYDLAKYLNRVYVKPIENRTGQIIRTEIKRGLSPSGKFATPAFALDVTYNTTSTNRGTRVDDSAVMVDIRIEADFTLSRIKTDSTPGGTLLRGTAEAVSRKNNTDDLYAAYVSEEEATKQSARLIGEDIVRQVRLFFRYPNRYPQIKDAKKSQPSVSSKRPQRQDYGPK